MRRIIRDLYFGRTEYRIVERRRIFYLASAAVVAASLVAVFTLGLNLSLDFKGGTSWKVSYGASVGEGDTGQDQSGAREQAREAGAPNEAAVRDAVARGGASAEKVLYLGGAQLEVQSAAVDSETADKVSRELAGLVGADPARFQEVVSVTSVSPTWGAQISRKALQALVIFLVAVSLYISLRFQWRMAVAALVALAHDIIITIGTYAITRFTVAPATVIATLTILGYSLYDDVVVFDRVKESAGSIDSAKRDYAEVVDKSLNQVLMRSLNTSLTSLLPVSALLGAGVLLGVPTLKDFALALFVGILSGTYSSIFVASPLLVTLGRHQVKSVGLAQAKERALEAAHSRRRAPRPGLRPTQKPGAAIFTGGSGSFDTEDEEAGEPGRESEELEQVSAKATPSGSRNAKARKKASSHRSVPSKGKGKAKSKRKKRR